MCKVWRCSLFWCFRTTMRNTACERNWEVSVCTVSLSQQLLHNCIKKKHICI
jgi:hypothetical protein